MIHSTIMKHVIWILACSIALQASAQVRMSATTRGDVAHLARIAEKEPDARKLTELTRGQFPTALIQGRCMVGFLGKAIDAGPMGDQGILVGARIGDIVSFRVDAQHLDRVQDLPGFSYLELAGTLRPSLDKVVRATHADSVQQGINLPQSYTGRDVIIGVADFGFQYAHPMFYDTALTQTRILAAWDMNKQSGPAPSGFNAGTEYAGAAAVITAEMDTLEANDFRDTHGTHVAGIAAGGGAGTAYRGIAFDAELLLVTMFHDFASALDAISWMQQRAQAEQKRLVVNMSWGGVTEAADGNTLFSQALDAFSDQGVVLVAAAGNFGGGAFHVQRSFNNDTLRTRVRATNPNVDPAIIGQRLMLWGDPGQPFSTSLTIRSATNAVLDQTPWMSTIGALPFTDSLFIVGGDTVHVQVVAEEAHPITLRPYLRIDVDKSDQTVRVDMNVTATSGTVHAFNALWWNYSIGWYDLGFQAAMQDHVAGDDAYGVPEPASASSVLAVGNYNAEYQTVAGTWVGGQGDAASSRGPSLDGRLKPEITAPGVSVMSSINSANTAGWPAQSTVDFQGNTYAFSRATGTSMASPAVTGVAALLLEAMPFATPAEIKQAIMDNARTDNHTGVIPPQGSNVWGMGKVNAYRAVVDMLGVVAIVEQDEYEIRVWPNPARDVLFVRLDNALGPLYCEVLDITGRRIEQHISTSDQLRIDTHFWNAGAYMLRVTDGRGTTVHRIAHY